MVGSLFCGICLYRPVFPNSYKEISIFLLAAIQFSVHTNCTSFFVEYAGNVWYGGLARLNLLPVVCENSPLVLKKPFHKKTLRRSVSKNAQNLPLMETLPTLDQQGKSHSIEHKNLDGM